MDRQTQSGNDRLHTDTGRGPQGVDKAPGEETSQNTENFVAQTQKGKNQVDGDPEKESDRPVEKQDIE